MQGEHPARQTLARQLMARAMTEGWMICYSALGDFLTLVLREQRVEQLKITHQNVNDSSSLTHSLHAMQCHC